MFISDKAQGALFYEEKMVKKFLQWNAYVFGYQLIKGFFRACLQKFGEFWGEKLASFEVILRR